MRNRARELFRIKTKRKEHEYLVGQIWYEEGGPNYFSGTMNRRGYYFAVTPREISPDGGVIFMVFSGLKHFLTETKRYSEKVLMEQIPDLSLVEGMITKVCNQEGIIL